MRFEHNHTRADGTHVFRTSSGPEYILTAVSDWSKARIESIANSPNSDLHQDLAAQLDRLRSNN